MAFVAAEVAQSLIIAVKPSLDAIAKCDRSLGQQARRAASSILLNLQEGSARQGADRLHLFRVARGSFKELCAALAIAVGWGYVSKDPVVAQLSDKLGALLYGLTESRRPA